jgi:hypothetical protein
MEDTTLNVLVDSVYIVNDTIILIINSTATNKSEGGNTNWAEIITIILAFSTFIFGFYSMSKQSKDSFATLEKQLQTQKELTITSLGNQNKGIVHQLKIDSLKKQSFEFIHSLRLQISKIISITAYSKTQKDIVSNIQQLYCLFIELQLNLNPKKPKHNELISLIEKILADIDNAQIEDLRINIKTIILLSKKIIIDEENILNNKINNL